MWSRKNGSWSVWEKHGLDKLLKLVFHRPLEIVVSWANQYVSAYITSGRVLVWLDSDVISSSQRDYIEKHMFVQVTKASTIYVYFFFQAITLWTPVPNTVSVNGDFSNFLKLLRGEDKMGGGHKTKPIIINLLIYFVLVVNSSVCNTGISCSIQKATFCVLCGPFPYRSQQA